jgi:hypothetical protein
VPLKNAVSVSVLSHFSDPYSNGGGGGAGGSMNGGESSSSINNQHASLNNATSNYPFSHINFPTKRSTIPASHYLLPKVGNNQSRSNSYASHYASNPAIHSIISKMNQSDGHHDSQSSMLPKLYTTSNASNLNTILEAKVINGPSKIYSKYA